MKAYPKPRPKPTSPTATNLSKHSRWWIDVPIEAVELAANINRLERIEAELRKLDHTHIAESITQDQRDRARRLLVATTAAINAWRRYAKQKLATEYLLPK